MHHCDAKEDDAQEVCEECAYDVIIADKSVPSGIASVCVCGLMHRAADAIEDLQNKLQNSENDNINLTGWLAEEHANQCPYYIRNVHNRGDDSLCTKWECEVKALPKWIPVTERLPDIGKDVLCFCRANIYFVLGWDGYHWHEGMDRYYMSSFVTHWMPLPQPPEDGES
jgi:hypothetical protein